MSYENSSAPRTNHNLKQKEKEMNTQLNEEMLGKSLTKFEPETAAPSIASSACLSELSISQWGGRKKDRKASKEVTANNNAASGVANVHKKLLGDCPELDAVHKMTGNIRNMHYAMTMPWSDIGMRLLPTKQYFNYHKQMTEMENEWYKTVEAFLNSYNWEISKAEAKLGNLFYRDEYPTVDTLKGKFSFNLTYIPIPETGDFRIDIGNEAKAEIVRGYGEYYSRQIKNAMDDIWSRLYSALNKMSERLDYTNSDNKKIFRDSIVSNVVDIIGLLDTCNVTGDSQMSAARLKLEEAMYSVTPDALREDDYLRGVTKKAMDDVIKSLPSLDI